MTIQHIEFGTPAFDEAVSLRNDILRIPLGLEFAPEDIQSEWDSYHLGLYDQSARLSGCLTLLPLDKKEIKMRQVAIAEKMQSKGLGTALVEASETFCRDRKFTTIVLHARKTAVIFYKKLGYNTKGKIFEEVGVPHFKMYKKL